MAPALRPYLVRWTWRPDRTVISHTIVVAESWEDAERIVRERELSEGAFAEHDGTVIERRV